MKNTFKQYTLRNIPMQVDKILRKRAKAEGKSFNEVAIEALARGVGESARPKRDLDFLIQSITPDEASQLEEAINSQRKIDPKIWKQNKK